MKEWVGRFLTKHGDRIFFLCGAIVMAIGFLLVKEMSEAGRTILIGCAMLLYNKARSPEKDK
jgi:hypothetical protein